MPEFFSTSVIVVIAIGLVVIVAITGVVWKRRRRQDDMISVKTKDGSPPDDIYPMW